MFGLISKKKLIREAVELYLWNDTSTAHDSNQFHYCAGNANALNSLCHRLGIDLTKEVREAKKKT